MSALGLIALAFILHTVLTVLSARSAGRPASPAAPSPSEDREAYERVASARELERAETLPPGNIAAAPYSDDYSVYPMSDLLPGLDSADDHFSRDGFDTSSWNDRS